VVSRDRALEDIDAVLAAADHISASSWMLKADAAAACQYWFGQVVAFLERTLPEHSFYSREAHNLILGSHRQGGIYADDVRRLIAHLRFLRDAIAGDLLHRTYVEVVAADLSEFLAYAETYFEAGQKVQASVIAAAVFEDSLRRLAREHGLESGRDVQIESLINALRTRSIVSKPDAQELKFLASIRNAAMHASWDEFDLETVGRMIRGTEGLLDKLLSRQATNGN
jgi:uncharacterized protein YutE (UPF0331/DUF86 family)